MIGVDWGTSSLRAFRMDAKGRVLETRRSDQGLQHAGGRFAEVLSALLEGWDERCVLMGGMIGSRQGWMEVPYVRAPADLHTVADGMRCLPDDTLPGRTLWLVPGVATMDGAGVPDVMRGEETQVCGLLPVLGEGRHVVLLPGTHSKHVHVRDGRIEGFSTFLTGELFALLRQHSLLGRMMVAGEHDDAAFAEGVARSARDGELLHTLFGVRTRALFDELAPHRVSSYLSGLLIGHELRSLPPTTGRVHVIAATGLAHVYAAALQARDIQTIVHDEATVAVGLHQLAAAHALSM